MRKLVIATHNAKKRDEIVSLLSGLPYEVCTLAEFPDAEEPEETGLTYHENAEIKVLSAVLTTGELCIADDSGIEIDGMPGELGVFSKRFGGEETSFAEKMQMILSRLEGLPEEERRARFRCVVALQGPAVHPVSEIIYFEGVCEGRIASAMSGSGGFGYDPIFIPDGYEQTFADLAPAEKHALSHRGKALAQLRDYLTTCYSESEAGASPS